MQIINPSSLWDKRRDSPVLSETPQHPFLVVVSSLNFFLGEADYALYQELVAGLQNDHEFRNNFSLRIFHRIIVKIIFILFVIIVIRFRAKKTLRLGQSLRISVDNVSLILTVSGLETLPEDSKNSQSRVSTELSIKLKKSSTHLRNFIRRQTVQFLTWPLNLYLW